MLLAAKQAISIKLATTVGHFLRDHDHDFANVYMPSPSCSFFPSLSFFRGGGVWKMGQRHMTRDLRPADVLARTITSVSASEPRLGFGGEGGGSKDEETTSHDT